MRTLSVVAQMTLRASGVVLLLLGVTLWTGHLLQLVPLHETLGFLLVLSLWTLAAIAARSGVPAGWVALAVFWGFLAPALGLTQDRLVTGDWHWTIQLLHLLIGVSAMAQGERLAIMIQRSRAAAARTTVATP